MIGGTFRPLYHSLADIAGTLAAVSGYKSSIYRKENESLENKYLANKNQ